MTECAQASESPFAPTELLCAVKLERGPRVELTFAARARSILTHRQGADVVGFNRLTALRGICSVSLQRVPAACGLAAEFALVFQPERTQNSVDT